jgi:hypothetical protein
MRVLIIPIMFLIVGLCGCTSNQLNEKTSKEINTPENVKNMTSKYEHQSDEINLSKEDKEINNLIKSSMKNAILIDCIKEESMLFDPTIADKYKINISNKELSTLIYNISSEPKFDYMILLYNKLKNNGWDVIRVMYDETTPDNRQEFEITFKKDDNILSIMIFKNDIDNSTEVTVEYLH